MATTKKKAGTATKASLARKQGEQKELGLFSLTGLVVGSIIGSGVFNMMSNMAQSAGLVGILLGWLVTAVGMNPITPDETEAASPSSLLSRSPE